MTDLSLSDDQRQYQDLARDFSQKEISPVAAAADHEGRLELDLCRQSWEIGLLNVRLPEAYGGLNLSLQDTCIIIEEIAAGCTGIAALFEGNEVGAAPILVAGTDEQKQRFLQPLASEFALCGYALQELSGAANQATVRATRDGAKVVLNGRCSVLNGSNARWFWVAAPLDSGELSIFVVPAETNGIQKGDRRFSLGRKAADVREIVFQETRLDSSCLISGNSAKGSTLAASIAVWQIITAAQCVGLSRSALHSSLRYAKERSTFGQPIANYQAVNFMLSDMAKDIEAGRLMTWKAALLYDQGQPSAVLSTEAKIHASESAMRIATDAVQIYGGYGYSREYPVEKLMRDAKMFQMEASTTHNQRVSLGKQLINAAGQ